MVHWSVYKGGELYHILYIILCMIGKGEMAGNGISKFYESVVSGEFFI